MHKNEQQLADAYAAFARGDLEGYMTMCSDDMTWTVPAPFSGTYTKATFPGFIGEVMQRCGGDFSETPVAIIANDEHGVVILDHFVGRNGQKHEFRVDHIYTFDKEGKFASFLERPGDEATFNRVWA